MCAYIGSMVVSCRPWLLRPLGNSDEDHCSLHSCLLCARAATKGNFYAPEARVVAEPLTLNPQTLNPKQVDELA